MERIVVEMICDRCQGSDRVETATLSVNGTSVEIELCPPCHSELLDPVKQLMAEHGRDLPAAEGRTSRQRRSQPPEPTGDFECQHCPRRFSKHSSRARHETVAHRKPKSEVKPQLVEPQLVMNATS